MKKEFDEKLVKECPNLYRDRYGDKSLTLMCWGFGTGDGWNELLYDLSTKLEKLILELPEGLRINYRAVQVKEKFGSLRFYMSAETEAMSALINDAEERSSYICEKCGKSGALRKGGWLKVLCDEHANGRELVK